MPVLPAVPSTTVPPGFERAAALGLEHDPLGGAILHRTAGIHELGLAVVSRSRSRGSAFPGGSAACCPLHPRIPDASCSSTLSRGCDRLLLKIHQAANLCQCRHLADDQQRGGAEAWRHAASAGKSASVDFSTRSSVQVARSSKATGWLPGSPCAMRLRGDVIDLRGAHVEHHGVLWMSKRRPVEAATLRARGSDECHRLRKTAHASAECRRWPRRRGRP